MSVVKIFNAYIRTSEAGVFLQEAENLRDELYTRTDLQIRFISPPDELAIYINCNDFDVYNSWLSWYPNFAERLTIHSDAFIIYWIGENECPGVPVYLKDKDGVNIGYIPDNIFENFKIYELHELLRKGEVTLSKLSGETPGLISFHGL